MRMIGLIVIMIMLTNILDDVIENKDAHIQEGKDKSTNIER